MAPKQRKRGGGSEREEDVFTLEAEGVAVEPKKEEQLNLWDGSALKRALDDAVIEAVTEKGLAVDHTFTDIKIALGLLCCGLACLAQFYPQKYPANFWLLVGCVAAYVLLSTLMTVIALLFEKDVILLTRAGGPSGLPALAISTRLPRFGDTYTLTIAPRGSAAHGSGAACNATVSRGVGACFHSDGFLAKEAIKGDTDKALAQLIEGKSK